MKMGKRVLALLLACCLFAMLFAACASSGGTGEEPSVPSSGAAEPSGDGTPTEEIVTIKMVFPDVRMTAADYGAPVLEAINAYTEETYGVHIDLQWMTYADLQTKLQLVISSGEQLDLIPVSMWNDITRIYPKGMLLDITEELQQYAPDALEKMQAYMAPYTYGGRYYGMPTLRNYSKNYYFIMRRDILEELNLTDKAENMQTFTEYEEILATVRDAYAGSGLYAIGNAASKTVLSFEGFLSDGDSFSDYQVYDYAADPVRIAMLQDNQVGCYVRDARYEAECARVAGWAQEGYLWPDAAIEENHGDVLMKQGVVFSTIQGSEYGVEVTKGVNCGYELLCKEVCPGMIKTDTLTMQGIGVPSTAEEPEAACRMINAMYTDATLMNLFVWGIEGTDYTVEDGQVVFPEGDHYYEADYFMGNNLLLTPLYGNGADYYEQVDEINRTAPLSDYLGFVVDTGALEQQSASLLAVADQYNADLRCGNYTPELYSEYLAKLEAAGADAYLAELQKQLDAWLAAK